MADVPVYMDDLAWRSFAALPFGNGGWTPLSPGLQAVRLGSEAGSERFKAPVFRLVLEVRELEALSAAEPRNEWSQRGLTQSQLAIPIATKPDGVQVGVAEAHVDRGRSGRAKGSVILVIERIFAVTTTEAIASWLQTWRDFGAFDLSKREARAPMRGGQSDKLPMSAGDAASDSVGWLEPQTEPAAEITVWFGTNRTPVRHHGAVIDFDQNIDTELHAGTCVVTVDKARPVGGFGDGILRRLLGLSRSGVEAGAIDLQGRDLFWSRVRERLRDREPGKRTAMVFVHGYCNTFFDSIQTAGVLGADVAGWDLTAAFCWPSAGVLTGYLRDGDMCAASEHAFEEFLRAMISRSGAERVHVIAHSMGNRPLVRAMERLRASPLPGGAMLQNIVYAAPDVERELFRRLVALGPGLPCRRTLYASRRDSALRKSRDWVNQTDRAGLAPPITSCQDVDTIDVTEVDLSANGHRAFREAPQVIEDLYYLTRMGHAPNERHGLQAAGEADGTPYWQFRRQRQ